MKNSCLFVLALAITLLASSCTKTETVKESSGLAIAFSGSHIGNPTRTPARMPAASTTLDSLKLPNRGFYVFGAYENTKSSRGVETVFDGKTEGSHVTWNVSSWGYSPINYWVDGALYKFAAYAPALPKTERSFDYATNTMTFTDFVSDGKTDFLVAAASVDGIHSSDRTAVHFAFRHALSKVRFTIKNGWRNNVTMALRDVTISNVNTKANLTTPANLRGSTAIDLSCWTEQSTSNSFVDKEGADLKIFDTTYVFEHFMIPQTISPNQVTFSFAVTVTNSEGGGPILNPDDPNAPHRKVLSIKLPVDVVDKWLPCHAYNYVLTVSGETFDLHAIQFTEIEVSDWNTDPETGVPQP